MLAQVVEPQRAAEALQFGGECVPDLAAIEIVQAVASELLEERAERINNVSRVVLPDT